MTNEDYVSYEIAQVLKIAGFDWPCRYFYGSETGLNRNCSKCNFNRDKIVQNIDYVIKHGSICSAPTLAQAQKWIRETKRWHIEVKINGCRNMFYVELMKIKASSAYMILEHENGRAKLFDTYESALSAGILGALQLIEERSEK